MSNPHRSGQHAGKTVIVYCTIGCRDSIPGKKPAENGIGSTNPKKVNAARTRWGGTVLDIGGGMRCGPDQAALRLDSRLRGNDFDSSMPAENDTLIHFSCFADSET
jgi:hypothetical protein